MGCTREPKLHEYTQRRSLILRIAASLLLAGVAFAQAPTIPTDHYGPPVCGTEQPSAHRTTPAAARAEQALGAANGHALLSDEPVQNFGIERYKLEDYGDCVGDEGCYWADLDAQYHRAETALADKVAAERTAPDRGMKLALVMDIDDTTLSSYCEMKSESFGYIGPMFHSWVVSRQAAVAIPGALRLFNEARAKNVAIFFITGRPGIPQAGAKHARNLAPEDETSATVGNLEAAGFHGWTGLALRNGVQNGMATIAFKSQERSKILGKNYKILMSVGDQWSDLLGDPQATVSVKLPNPFYFLP